MDRFVVLALALASGLASPGVGQRAAHTVAQPKSHTTLPSEGDAAGASSEGKELQQALAIQQAALASGDAVRIQDASTRLHALALRQLATIALARGEVAHAAEYLRKSLVVAPSIEGRLELASVLLRSGDATAAANEAFTAIEMDPANALAWAVRGGALRAARREQEAVVAFEQSMRLEARPDVAYQLGCTLLKLHEKAKADEIFAQILKASGYDAARYVEIGDAYRQAEYLPDAISAFQEAVRRNPRVAHGEFFLGLTYLQLHQWGPNPDSLRHLREAVRIAPTDYISNFYLGALESTEGSDLPGSDRHLRAAAEADPEEPEVWLYLGLNANREHRLVEAKANLRKAIELTGSDQSRNNYQVRKAYFTLGRILVSEGQQEEGKELLAKYTAAEQAAVAESGSSIRERAKPGEQVPAVAGGVELKVVQPLRADQMATSAPSLHGIDEHGTKLTPEQEHALSTRETALRHLLATSGNDLGTADAREQHYEQALEAFVEAEQWEPPTPALLRNEGAAAFRLGRYDIAAAALRRYFETAEKSRTPPNDERAQLMLAMSEFSTGHFPEAATAFSAAHIAAMADARAAYSWAYALAHTGQAQEANRIAADLTARDLPIEQRMLVCHLFVDTEDYAGSAACYRRAYTQDPTVRLAHYEAGEALVRLDRATEALPELRAELQLSPNDPNVQYALAYALLQLSQKAEAQPILESLVANHPEQAEAQYQLGKLLIEQGKLPEAIVHLEASERASAPSPGGTPDYVHYQLGTAYRKAGRSAEAEKELALYREIKDRKRADPSGRE